MSIKRSGEPKGSEIPIQSHYLPCACLVCSSSNLQSLELFFAGIPVSTRIAYVVIIDALLETTDALSGAINKVNSMPVCTVEKSTALEPDRIYLQAPGYCLLFEAKGLKPYPVAKKRKPFDPIDLALRSLAKIQKSRATVTILSRIEKKWWKGMEAIKKRGGSVLVLKPEFKEMKDTWSPEADHKLIDEELGIDLLPEAVIRSALRSGSENAVSNKIMEDLHRVLSVIRNHTHYDFGCYKHNTLLRRIERRMALSQIASHKLYLEYLESNPTETEALYRDLLIGVTGFFREAQVWEKVEKDILNKLVAKSDINSPVRIWVPGCSTGEEPYTIAILLRGLFAKANREFNAQIFATDIDEDAIKIARRGIYPDGIRENVSPDRLQKFFSKEERGYRINREIREAVVFAVQNLIGDAPFSNLDLISCRNLLIYLEPTVQKKVIELFHFSLKRNGILVLGNSETIGMNNHLYTAVSKELRIYRSIGTHSHERLQIPILPNNCRSRPATGFRAPSAQKNISQLLQNQLLKRYAPAAVLINRSYEILQFHGPTGDYLDLPAAEPVLDLLSMVKDGLRVKLRTAIHKMLKSADGKISCEARIKQGTDNIPVLLTVRPVIEPDYPEGLLMVTFEESKAAEPVPITPESREVDEQILRQLEAELLATREDLQNTIEELEASNEDLKASNEEIMSMNEELQSSNEELETSKEELQSLNEELNTVNAQLCEKVKELENTNNDLINLIDSTEVATIFLNTTTLIRRFTPAAKQLFNLIPSDVGRPIGDLTRRFNDDDLQAHTEKVLATLTPSTKEVETEEGNWYIRRILPFRTLDNRIDGLVLTFTDVTGLKKSESALRESEERYRLLFEHAPISMIVFQNDRVKAANAAAVRMFETTSIERLLGKSLLDLVDPNEFNAIDLLAKPLLSRTITPYREQRFRRMDGTLIQTLSGSIPINWRGEAATLGVAYDITEQRKATQEREKILNSVVSGVYLHNIRTRTIDYINPEYTKITGWDLSDLAGLSNGFADIIYPDDQVIAQQHADQVAQDTTDETHRFEYRLKTKSGKWIWCLSYETPFERDAKGSVIRYIGSVIDISDRVSAEIALNDSYQQTFTILESISDGFFTLDNDFRVTYFNLAAEQLLGRSNGDVIGRKLFDAFPEAKGSIFERNYRWAMQEKKTIRFETYFDKAPYTNWYDVKVYPYRGGISVYFQVTTEHKKSEEVINNFFEQSLVMLFIADLATDKCIRINQEVVRITGRSEQEWLSLPLYEFSHSEDRASTRAALRQLAEGKALVGYRNRQLTATGEVRIFEWTATPDSERRLLYAMALDVTEHVKAEQDLLESEERFRSAFENANVGVCLVSLHGVFTRVNLQLCEMLGYGRNELEGMHINDVTHADNRNISPTFIEQALTGKTEHAVFEKKYLHKQGHTVWGQVSSSLIKNASGEGIYFICHVMDITERKQAETQIQISLNEKEVLLQEIHHRVKNNMAVISSLLRLQASSEDNQRITEILKESQDRVYAMAVVHETLYRSDNLSQISIETYLTKISQALFHSYLTIPHQVNLTIDCDEIMLTIEKASPLGLVINELISNALKHAFPTEKKGEINIAVKRVVDNKIKITVKDNGIGLPTGLDWKLSKSLGLQLVHTLVMDQLDGEIQVVVDNGTMFAIAIDLSR